MQSFEPYAKYNTRATESACDKWQCYICNIARSNPFSGSMPMKPKRGRPSSDDTPQEHQMQSVKICPKCFSILGRGLSHTCTKEEKIKNTSKMLSPKSKEILCSSVIMEKRDSRPQASASISIANNGGRPTRIEFNQKSSKLQLSYEDMCGLQSTSNLSGNQVNAVAQTIRRSFGRHTIEPNLKEHLSNISKRLGEYFMSYEMSFFKKSSKGNLESITRPAVFVNDLHGLLNEIYNAREIQSSVSDTIFKLGIDGGQGFFNVCLNVIQQIDECSTSLSNSKEGSVNGLFILAIIPEIDELYRNVQICLENIDGLHDLPPFVVTTDLKLANVLCGLQSHGAHHPCCYCEGTSGIWESDARMRTVRNIRENYVSWIKSGGNLVDCKHYHNCVKEPLLKPKQDENETILSLIPPPELHILMGAFSSLYKEMKMIYPEIDSEWTDRLYVKPTGYHGGSNFTGGDCMKLLRNIDLLARQCPIQILPFVDALRKLRDVVDACFGKILITDFPEKILAFDLPLSA